MRGVTREFVAAARRSPAIYFAPLLGAIQGIKAQWARHCAQMAKRR